MAININEFKANLSKGGARPNLFKVSFAGNTMVGGVARKMSFLVQASSLPASTLGTIEVPYEGRKIKVAGDRTYAEWSVTVINNEDFSIRAAMEDWSYRINHYELNVRDAGAYDLDQYKQDASVQQLNKAGDVIAEYKFVGMYPQEIAAIELDWSTTDTIETFTCNFVYDYFVPSELNANVIAG